MLKIQLHQDTAHDNKRATRKPVLSGAWAFALTAALGLAVLGSPAQAAEPVKAGVARASLKDPLAGDTWHAVDSTWPGTIVFDGAKKAVTLAPIGATPMEATYSYTVKPTSAKNVVEGTLRMTNSAKQVSESTFRITDGKNMTLTFKGGPRAEQYVRMTPKEEEAEKAKLQKMISEGRIRPLK